MNENAKLWVSALRSGEYQQGKGQLSLNGRFCCLGVACDIYEKYTGDELPKDRNSNYIHAGTYGIHHAKNLHSQFNKVREWLGLSFCNGHFKNGSVENSLTSLNDSAIPFTDIANIIQSEPLGLFVE